MIPLEIIQGSTEWLIARLWRLTASDLKSVLTPSGGLSDSAASRAAIDKLIAGIELANIMQAEAHLIDEMDEWELKKFMCDYTGQKFMQNAHTLRGHRLEPDALAALSVRSGHEYQELGMCVMGDDPNGVVSCSPDGFKFNERGAEVKSVSLCTWLKHVRENILPVDYSLQVHSSMAICEVDAWDFGSYFEGKPIFYKEVKWDETTDKVKASLEKFSGIYSDQYREVNAAVEALSLKPVHADEFTEKVRSAQDNFIIDYAPERKKVLDAIMIKEEMSV